MQEQMPEIFARINVRLKNMQPLFTTGYPLDKETSAAALETCAGKVNGYHGKIKPCFSNMMRTSQNKEETGKLLPARSAEDIKVNIRASIAWFRALMTGEPFKNKTL